MSDEPEEDAYGCTGARVECWVCRGRGVDWGETCVTCGGYGWINELPLLMPSPNP